VPDTAVIEAPAKEHRKPPLPSPLPSDPLSELWLLGQPPLERLLEFAEDTLPAEAKLDRAALVQEWRRAGIVYQELERSQAGLANKGTHRALDPAYAALAGAVKQHPDYRSAFDTLPTEFAMVELDQLIVCQMHVTHNFVEGLKARLGPAPTAQALFHTCLPQQHPGAPVRIRKVGSHRVVFDCDSTDLRFHEAALLQPAQLTGYGSFGPIAGVVGLVVGFGANFLNVVRVGNRWLLNNGYHRAVALRGLGITHAPCIVQTAHTVDELELTVKSRVAEDASYFFESARPPLLRDFFDPRLCKLMPIRKRRRQIELNFEIKDYLVAE
jgi:hypothetical protein